MKYYFSHLTNIVNVLKDSYFSNCKIVHWLMNKNSTHKTIPSEPVFFKFSQIFCNRHYSKIKPNLTINVFSSLCNHKPVIYPPQFSVLDSNTYFLQLSLLKCFCLIRKKKNRFWILSFFCHISDTVFELPTILYGHIITARWMANA